MAPTTSQKVLDGELAGWLGRSSDDERELGRSAAPEGQRIYRATNDDVIGSVARTILNPVGVEDQSPGSAPWVRTVKRKHPFKHRVETLS